MSHKNLPALNKYTSAVQYEALKEINDTNSIVKIVQNGRSSKTLGALIRCMWIKQKDYTDDNGVLREGWFVTEDGLHAMNLFAEKERAKQDEANRIAELLVKFEKACLLFKEKSKGNRAEIGYLKLEIEKLEKEIKDAENEANSIACFLDVGNFNAVLVKLDMLGYKKQREYNPNRNPHYDYAQYEDRYGRSV
jgi:hypothetical protein